MILKVGDDYIYGLDVTIEKKSRLFESIGSIQGDVSYSFTIPDTSEIRYKLGIINNSVFEKKEGLLLSDGGIPIYYGFLIIENVDNGINCVFFSGNSNWINELDFPLNEIDFSSYNIDANSINISSAQTNKSGVVFPLIDNGCLYDRVSPYVYPEDFHPFIHIKDVFKAITAQTGVKIEGELLNDPRFNKLITSNNGRSGVDNEINKRKVYIGKNSTQTLIITGVPYNGITFTNTSSPYSNSILTNWDTSTSKYTFDVSCKKFTVDINLKFSTVAYIRVYVVINGNLYLTSKWFNNNNVTHKFEIDYEMDAGDTVEIRGQVFLGSYDLISGSWIKVEPVKFRFSFVQSILPQINCSDFISDIFKMFNIVTSYNGITKTITTKFFSSIKNSEIDITNYCSEYTTDYSEFISDYAIKNLISYSTQSSDEIDLYNDQNEIEYGGGVIEVTNDYVLEEEGSIFELNFIACIQRDIQLAAASMPSTFFKESSETTDTRSITSVTSGTGGRARFNFSGSSISIGTLCRISDSTNSNYNGDFVVEFTGSGYVEFYGQVYDSTATATLTILEIVDIDNNDQVLLLYESNTDLDDFTGVSTILYDGSVDGSYSFAYFYLPDNGYSFKGKQALYFDKVSGNGINQTSMINDYFMDVEMIFNNPIKIKVSANIPESLFLSIDFLSSVRIKTNEFNGLFYVDRITDYQNSYTPCTIELIKLP